LAGKCELCGKSSGHGHNVSHSKRRTNRIWQPNLQKAKLMLGGKLRQVRVCTQCLRTYQKTATA
jgi:large subunit ribosomal protein L28